jgi:hypothetical protein
LKTEHLEYWALTIKKTPRRQADFVYNLSPTYVFDLQTTSIWLTVRNSKSFAADDNNLIQDMLTLIY